ncbi:MAG: hypothetical protein ACRD0C_23240 [Acidimicrobiia bacterium]
MLSPAPAQVDRRVPAWRSVAVSGGLATVALLSGTVLLAVGADNAGVSWKEAPGYAHWDSAHYLSIAERGYDLVSCAELGLYRPDDWCGNAGWFPGYPATIRAVSRLGLPAVEAGVVISHLALFGVLFLVAWFLRALPLADRLVAVLGASFFPGAVYYRAVFPISLTLLGVLACLLALRSRRWVVAGLLSSVAVAAYPQGVALGAAAIPFFLSGLRRDRRDLRVAVGFLALVTAAFLAVLLMYDIRVGRWDAYFLVQAKYDPGLHFPVTEFLHHLGTTTAPTGETRAPGAQTALVAVVLLAVFTAAWWHRARLGTFHAAVVAVCALTWLMPLSLGGELSLYRREGLVLPAVLLLPLLPRWLAVGLVVASAAVMVPISRQFFAGVLV